MKQRFKQSRAKIGQPKLLTVSHVFHQTPCEHDTSEEKLEHLIRRHKNNTKESTCNRNRSKKPIMRPRGEEITEQEELGQRTEEHETGEMAHGGPKKQQQKNSPVCSRHNETKVGSQLSGK
jgi:hypothetical protein